MSKPAYVRETRLIANVAVPMRDGVKLATTVCLPKEEGRYPVVLVRTAYNRWADRGFNSMGIATVTQDCRGRYGSEGDHYPFVSETQDGLDTLEWIANQPWCNGKIGMYGDSYLAGTQLAVAAPGHRALAALNPRFMSGDCWRQAYYCDGVFSLALVFSWLVLEVGSRTSEANLLQIYDIDKLLRELPTIDLDTKFGVHCRAWRDYATHYARDKFWEHCSWRESLGQTRVPMLLTGGWYDYYPNETFRNYEALLKGPAPDEIKRGHRVLMGPWTHGMNGTTRLGQLDFGADALRENDSTVRWLECLLKGGKPSDYQSAPIRIFVMGENRWRDENEWPLARTRYTKYYLHSQGNANSLLGNGSLSLERPGAAAGSGEEAADKFTYDPNNPVPTMGGNHSVGPYNPGLYELALPGPYDQRPIERRDDVLVYTSAELAEDVEVTGPIMLHLFASSSAPDTDFTARLTDVYPDGRSMNITEGVIRARFRERDWANPKLLEPGKVYEFTIELQPTSNVFRRGHRLRLDVSSSNFPLWNRNLNTDEHPNLGTKVAVAEQTILHDRARASYLELPVIPRS